MSTLINGQAVKIRLKNGLIYPARYFDYHPWLKGPGYEAGTRLGRVVPLSVGEAVLLERNRRPGLSRKGYGLGKVVSRADLAMAMAVMLRRG